MATKGRLVIIPFRTHPKIEGVPDEVITMPEYPMPPETSIPSAPPITVTPGVSDFGRYGSVPIRAVMNGLPRLDANKPVPATFAKSSLTVHWEGDTAQDVTDDARMFQVIVETAKFHISKDWGGGYGGSGIMYHEVISPTGTVFVTRNWDEVLWHCGDEYGNKTSRAILVYCGANKAANDVQIFRLKQRVLDFKVPVYPHSKWSPTACPGDQLRAVIAAL